MDSAQAKTTALLIQEDSVTLTELTQVLEKKGLDVYAASSPQEALIQAEQNFFDLIFMASQFDGQLTDSLLARLTELFPETIIVITSLQADLAEVVEMMRLGAFDYLPLPATAEQIAASAEQALEFRRLRRENIEARRERSQPYDVDNIIGQSQPMRQVFRMIHKVAATDATVLVLGESGTGKELVARAIHHHSKRKDRPLIPVNCGAIPEELLESELFGHERGAFTGAVKTRQGRFELAEGGTVFLDEIGDMSPTLQVKLLRVLQEHQFERVGGAKTITADIRIIAATHRNLGQRVETGEFREDLYYRLNVVPITIPPLRERRSDIILLSEHFLERMSRQKNMPLKKLHPEVMECLMRYNWPGNVRELENLLERMLILAEGDLIVPEDLPQRIRDTKPEPLTAPAPAAAPPAPAPQASGLATASLPPAGINFNAAVDSFERQLILQALERTGWIKNQAAALLGLNRTTLVEKIKKKNLQPNSGF